MTRSRPQEKKLSEQYVLEDVRVVRETDKALLIAITDHDEEWIPKSQIDPHKSTAHEPGDQGDLVISMWLAKKNEWVRS